MSEYKPIHSSNWIDQVAHVGSDYMFEPKEPAVVGPQNLPPPAAVGRSPPSSPQTTAETSSGARRFRALLARRASAARQRARGTSADVWLKAFGALLVCIAAVIVLASPRVMHRDHKWALGVGAAGAALVVAGCTLRIRRLRAELSIARHRSV